MATTLDENMTVGERLRYLRVVKFDNMPQTEVAERVKEKLKDTNPDYYENFSQPTYNRLENDRMKRPPIILLETLAEVFEVAPEYLLVRKEEDLLSHLPPLVRDWVLNPANEKAIYEAFVKSEHERLQSKASNS